MDVTTLHLITGQMPILASLVATGVLLIGLLRRQKALIRVSLYLFVLAALTALPVYFGGATDETAVLTPRTLFGIEVMGLLALGGLILSWLNARKLAPSRPGQQALSFRALGLPLWAAGVLAGLSLLNDGLLLQTAYLEGRPAEAQAEAGPESQLAAARMASQAADRTQGPWLEGDRGANQPATPTSALSSTNRQENAASAKPRAAAGPVAEDQRRSGPEKPSRRESQETARSSDGDKRPDEHQKDERGHTHAQREHQDDPDHEEHEEHEEHGD